MAIFGKRYFLHEKYGLKAVNDSEWLFLEEAFQIFPPFSTHQVRYIPEPGDLIIRVSMVDVARASGLQGACGGSGTGAKGNMSSP